MGTAIFSGVQGYLDLFNLPLQVVPAWAWLTMLIAGLSMAPFFAYRRLHKDIAELQNQKPVIHVQPKVSYANKAVLEVHNDGASDTFTVTARVTRGNIESNLLNPRWQSCPNDTTCQINHDDTKSILVAEIASETELNDNERTAIFAGGIALCQMGGKRIGVGDYQVVQDAKWKERYPSMFKNASELIDECEIEVTITSGKGLLKPFNEQKYLIKIDLQHNGELIFTPVLSPRREGLET